MNVPSISGKNWILKKYNQEDIKFIKENVDPNIKFDFSFDEKQMQILRDNKII